MKDFLTVKINCKPVVKSFLESNFGNPVRIPDEHPLYKLACSQLTKKNIRANDTIEYTDHIELGISEANFRFDGHSIADVNIRIFNTAVDNYIKVLCRSSLDSLLLMHDKQINWKLRCMDLISFINKNKVPGAEVDKKIKELKSEIEANEINIKEAINIVVTTFLKIDSTIYNYEAVKKDYYRYRMKKIKHEASPNIN